MFYTLGLKQLPFEQDTRQIIYIESEYDIDINNLIKLNYLEICDYFQRCGYKFCYLPWLTREFEEGEDYKYFIPYRKNKRERLVIKSDFILDYMVHPEKKKNISPSLLYYHPDCIRDDYPEAECQYFGVTITKESFEESSDLSSVLKAIIKNIMDHREPLIRFQKVSRVEYDIRDEEEIGASCRVAEDFNYDADLFFDSESRVLMEEIRERIEKLNKKGIGTYIIKQLLKEDNDKLSRLFITKGYRIILPDYKNIEIRMTPLPKAVFILFLNHPEGILFKHLTDYQDELLDIYKKVKGPLFESSSGMKSIEDVTNPLSNSINEKCARIRESFVSQFDERLSRWYFVDGKRGEPKKIALPRNLVEWEE